LKGGLFKQLLSTFQPELPEATESPPPSPLDLVNFDKARKKRKRKKTLSPRDEIWQLV